MIEYFFRTLFGIHFNINFPLDLSNMKKGLASGLASALQNADPALVKSLTLALNSYSSAQALSKSEAIGDKIVGEHSEEKTFGTFQDASTAHV